jgi:hypothetical protein
MSLYSVFNKGKGIHFHRFQEFIAYFGKLMKPGSGSIIEGNTFNALPGSGSGGFFGSRH